MTLRVLVIEDEPSFVEALTVGLGREGYSVDSASDGRDGLARFAAHPPDIVLLDLMLPEMGGLDVLRAMRKTSAIPVIVVSAKDAEADVVAALEMGADDYVTKPFSIRELIARIRAATRRSQGEEAGDVVVVGSVSLDRGAMRLTLVSGSYDLPKKEFEVLALLMERPGRVIAREEFLDQVWGYDWIGETRTLDQHIRRLRRRLEVDPGAPRIETVRGVGYRLVG